MNTVQKLVVKFKGARVLVVGDVMLDIAVHGRVSRISPEAPVPVVDMLTTEYSPGGAGNVAANLVSLEATAFLFGVVGRDEAGAQLQGLCSARGIDPAGLFVDANRPTTTKTRILAQSQQLLRLDHESTDALELSLEQRLAEAVIRCLPQADILVISDYAKGTLSPGLLRRIIPAAQQVQVPVVLGPKGCDYHRYAGASVIIPNLSEALLVGGIHDVSTTVASEQWVDQAVAVIFEQTLAQAVLVTRGEQGMSLYLPGKAEIHLPTRGRQVYDVTGAGDTVISIFSLAYTCEAAWEACAHLANMAAGIVVGKPGTAWVSPQELIQAADGE